MKYSVIVPIYNDAELAHDFCQHMQLAFEAWRPQALAQTELIFVNDGSPKKNSMEILSQVAEKFSFVKVLGLSRNFGQHIALSAGYAHAAGQYVGMLNVDMQDPPTEICKLLEELEKGKADIVYGLADKRQENIFKQITSTLFYKTINYLTQSNVPLNVATIRFMNRKFVDAYNSLNEKSRYLPGLENWLGFEKAYIPTIHTARKTGKSSYTFRKRLKMGINAILGFSDYPLKLLVYLGTIISVLGFLLALYLIVTQIFFIDYLPGYSSTLVAIVFFGGVQILVVGLAALYIGRILSEVQNRPLYIIQDKINF